MVKKITSPNEGFDLNMGIFGDSFRREAYSTSAEDASCGEWGFWRNPTARSGQAKRGKPAAERNYQ